MNNSMHCPIKRQLLALALAVFLFCTFGFAQPVQAQANGCGPEGFSFLAPDGPFTEACNSHDLCYGDTGIDQVECDRIFKEDMYAICQKKYSGSDVSSCKAVADYYYRAVTNFGEIFVTLEGRNISGKIVSVKAKRIDDWFGDDEFEACVTFKNDGDVNTEYDLELYAKDGSFIDREPDTYEVNVKVGESAKRCVGTDGIYPSISDLGKRYRIQLRVDAPQESLMANLINDFIVVDTYEGKTP